MVLLAAVVIGLTAGMLRAWQAKRLYYTYLLQYPWLVLLAFLPQWLFFAFPATRSSFPGAWAPFALVGSQIILLIFVWLNRTTPGFWLLGLGLILNLLVIILNGGLMPLSPETAAWLEPETQLWRIGERFGFGKDIVLPVSATRLWFLADQLRTPDWLRYPVAFSLGDVLIASGTMWLLWTLGGPPRIINEVKEK
jgi:hypothetical protein